jgi:hypothetical protein
MARRKNRVEFQVGRLAEKNGLPLSMEANIPEADAAPGAAIQLE